MMAGTRKVTMLSKYLLYKRARKRQSGQTNPDRWNMGGKVGRTHKLGEEGARRIDCGRDQEECPIIYFTYIVCIDHT